MAEPRDDVAVAAIALLPFGAVVAVLLVVAPPGADQLAAADPLVRSLRALGGLPLVPALVAVAAVTWLRRRRPTRQSLERGFVRAVAGAFVAAGVLFVVARIGGGRLPGFVPPEESARPGTLLGLSAGVVEETIFRLAVLPAVYALAAPRTGRPWAICIGVAITAAAFALSHEGWSPFRADLFLTRFVVPGALMSALYFRPGPAFIVSAHATAHLLIPLWFR